jgi:hypothetical protein
MLIIFNILFWFSGAALLAVGIWLMIDSSIVNYVEVLSALDDENGSLLKIASYVLIGVGGFVLIVGFFGCCGAIKENKCMLGTYIFLLVIVMGAEIAAGVFGIIYKDKILGKATNTFQDAIKEKYGKTDTDSNKAFTEGLNYIQFKAKCCGWNSAEDYISSEVVVPSTCCVISAGTTESDPTKITYEMAENEDACKSGDAIAVNVGCKDDLTNWIDQHSIIIIGVGIGIACLELFGFIFAICLCRNIGE